MSAAPPSATALTRRAPTGPTRKAARPRARPASSSIARSGRGDVVPRAGCSADACQQSAAQLMRRRGRGSAKTQWRLQNQASVSTHTSTTTDRPHTIRITKNKRLTPNGGGVGRVENIMGTGVRRPRPEEEPTPGARRRSASTGAPRARRPAPAARPASAPASSCRRR